MNKRIISCRLKIAAIGIMIAATTNVVFADNARDFTNKNNYLPGEDIAYLVMVEAVSAICEVMLLKKVVCLIQWVIFKLILLHITEK